MAPPESELTSWKEIAAYLGVGVRTAQIWERERGLPVRRLPGARGRVRITVAELEAWKHSGSVNPTPAEPAVEPIAPPEPVPPPTPRSRLRPALWLTAAALAALVLIVTAAHSLPGEPASYRIEAASLTVLDARGRECFRKSFPVPLQEGVLPRTAVDSVWLGDLDGDGHNEVLFAPHPVDTQTSTPLICYSSRGAERWRFVNDMRVRSAEEAFSPSYGVMRFLVAPLGDHLSKAILVSTTHRFFYPCRVSLLDPHGRVLRDYWHSGHLNYLRSADLDRDGRTEFYLAGIDNAHHAATLVVLDADHFAGASQEPAALAHQLLGMRAGEERARVILPRSCLSESSDPYNGVHSLTVVPGEILVETFESIAGGAGIFYHFSPDLRERRPELSDSYRVEYSRAFHEGRLRGCRVDSSSLTDGATAAAARAATM